MQIRRNGCQSELGTFQKLKNRARKDEKAACFDGEQREGEKGERCRC